MNKVIREGKVAILYSPGYGAGWYTWNYEYPEIVFDPGIVDLVENKKFDEIETYATLKYPEIYLGGVEDLTIAWVNEGTRFIIEEYDGSESVTILEQVNWLVA